VRDDITTLTEKILSEMILGGYKHTCGCVHTLKPAYTHSFIYKRSRTYILTRPTTHTHTLTYTHTNTHTPTHTHTHAYTHTHTYTHTCHTHTHTHVKLVGSLKLQVSFAKETYKRDNILQKSPII